jgi:hypothetical protein
MGQEDQAFLRRVFTRQRIRAIALIVFALALNSLVSEAALAATRFHP